MNLTILSVKYEEISWLKTRECIEATGLSVVYVDRNPKGCGSLSEAINRGMKEVETDYVFLCTNITFKKEVVLELYEQMKYLWNNKIALYAAICPVYGSDHPHLRKGSYKFGCALFEVPFIEFTAGIFRTDLLKQFPLDEDMPYVGQDLDWSHRVNEAGYYLGSLKSAEVGHKYIRQTPKTEITLKRLAMRKAADASTIAKLEAKYGSDWRNILKYHNGIASK